MQMTIPAKPPFSLSAVVRSHGWIQLAPFSSNDPWNWLTFVDRLNTGRVVEVLISEVPDGVQVDVAGQLSRREQNEIKENVTWMLALDVDLSPFYAQAQNEPKLANVEKKAQGRILRCPILFEDILKTLLTTNTSWAGTLRMNNALVSEFGEPLPEYPDRRAFPTPDRLAATDEETLRTSVRLGYRSPYVLELAREVIAGELELELLKSPELPTAEAQKRLLAIKGVGEYAAAALLMILGRYDFIPVDSWAINRVSHEWYGGERIGRAEVEAAFEHWGPWKGLAFWFWDWSYRHPAAE